MARSRTTFVCQSCGAFSSRWQGKCESCGAWNSLVQETIEGIGAASANALAHGKGKPFRFETLDVETAPVARKISGIAELDRVAGGGFVPGSVLLIGGEPGIGKSTLLIQACAAFAREGARVCYISGEEATGQVRLRAQRLGLADAPVELAAQTRIEDILASLSQGPSPALVVIDSIQTMYCDSADSAPGTVTQVRACAQGLIRYAKTTGAIMALVGHVTKDGQIAGPRVVEHMVDAVFSFEGDGAHHFRILRASKNRFGPTDEIGVFEMTGGGLSEVANPSALFLAGRDAGASGAAVLAGMEGSRPLLLEVQALVTASALSQPRRAVVGWDPQRLAMTIAVLEAHGGVRLGQHDVYLSVAGGLAIREPAADLAAAAALVSSLTGAALPPDCVFFGELGLSGAARPVIHTSARLKEATKLGFRRAVAPPAPGERGEETPQEMQVGACAHISSLVARIARLAPARVENFEAKKTGRKNDS